MNATGQLLLQLSPIPLKLYRCLGCGLVMCILFGYNPQIILSLFPQNELSHFPAKVNRY